MLIIHGFQHEDDWKMGKQKKIFRVFFFSFYSEWILTWKVDFDWGKKRNLIQKNKVIKKQQQIYAKYNKNLIHKSNNILALNT